MSSACFFVYENYFLESYNDFNKNHIAAKYNIKYIKITTEKNIFCFLVAKCSPTTSKGTNNFPLNNPLINWYVKNVNNKIDNMNVG